MERTLDRVARRVDEYWASTQDLDQLVGDLISRKKAFFDFIGSSNHFARIARNWAYYYNLYYKDLNIPETEIRKGGEEGEYAMIAINHFRSLVQLILSYAVQNRPAWDTQAINSDYRSMQQAKLGNDILDYYMEEEGVEAKLVQAAEDALVLSVGYLKITWDEGLGKEVRPDPETGVVYREGDIAFENPSIFDVIHDYTIQDWGQCQWVLVRTRKNRWDLQQKYPEWAEEIANAETTDERDYDFYRFDRSGQNMDLTDLVDTWEFYHDKTPAIPEGRFTIYVGDNAIYDGPLPYRQKPIYRIVPAEFRLTSLGYTPGFDLQGIQEAINAEYSTILTNHKNLGPTKIWFKTGDNINMAQLEPGITVIQSDTKPEPLPLTNTPREYFQFLDYLRQDGEYVSGVNSVARGQPEASLKSGAALALIDQKASQFNSRFIANVYKFMSDSGTGILRILKQFPNSKRFIYVAGINNRSELREFQKDDLENIDRVIVQMGNPLQRTLAGRLEIATQLLQAGLVKVPEEFLTVLQTGQLEPLTDTLDSQLAVIHQENEALKVGQPVSALMTDDQALHLKKHAAVLDSLEMRNNPIVLQSVLSHIAQHQQLLMSPAYGSYASVLGYQFPPPMPVPDMGGNEPGGGPTEKPAKGMSAGRTGMPEAAGLESQSAALEGMPLR
jgi:hypothetical protein